MPELPSFIRKVVDNKHYCAKCGKKYEGQNDKKKCDYCGKYYCNDHITTSLHSSICLQKATDEYNKKHCHYCSKTFDSWADIHDCSICGFSYCSQHWVPESHGCRSGKRPSGGMREVHHAGGGITVYGK